MMCEASTSRSNDTAAVCQDAEAFHKSVSCSDGHLPAVEATETRPSVEELCALRHALCFA